MSGGANLGSRLTADMAADGDIHIRDHVLYELARDLSSSLELDSVLRNVMDRVISLMHASRGFIVLVDPVTNEMSVQMGGGETDTEKSRHFLGSKTVIDHVVKSGQAVVSTDASAGARELPQQVLRPHDRHRPDARWQHRQVPGRRNASGVRRPEPDGRPRRARV